MNPAGEALIAGNTNSTDYPTTPGALSTARRGIRDAFVAKMSADGGSLVYSTYLGGSNYGETALGVAFDPSGSAWVVGYTDSGDFRFQIDLLIADF